MRILSISSIIPVPDLSKENDFVAETYSHYLEQYPDDRILILKPVRLDLNPFSIFKRSNPLRKMRKLGSYKLKGLRVIILPFLSAWRARSLHAMVSRTLFILNRKKLQALMLQEGFDIIHAQFILPDGLLARKLSVLWGIPYVITTHHEKFYFDYAISRADSMRILTDARAVLPLNHFNYTFFKDVGISGLQLLPIGIEKRFVKEQKDRGTGPVSILSVCSLIPLKNIDKVIRALAVLKDRYEFHYTVAGQGPEKESLESLTKNLGMTDRVSFLGAVPYGKIDLEMYRHDIFIMPSFFETFGRVYLECMAMGIPVICAKNSGIYGIFREGKEGYSVDHTSVEDIASTLEILISDHEKCKEVGKAGKRLAEKFTWERVNRQLRAIYLEALNPE